MREGAQAKADELGVKFQAFAGKFDGDNDSQVAAVENLISAGAKGILITPSDTKAIVPTIQKARDAGILVIALDTPLDPIDAADATFATDNFKAGELIGEWAAKTLGPDGRQDRQDRVPRRARAAADRRRGARPGLHAGLRHRREGPEPLPRRGRCPHLRPPVGPGRRGRRPDRHGERFSRSARTSTSSTPSTSRPRPVPGKPSRRSARTTVRVLVTSVDGGCPGVKNVEAGVIGATSMQFPLLMAVARRRGGCRVRQDRQEARADPRPRVLQHRRVADHRQAGRRRSVRDVGRRPDEVLGLIVPPDAAG